MRQWYRFLQSAEQLYGCFTVGQNSKKKSKSIAGAVHISSLITDSFAGMKFAIKYCLVVLFWCCCLDTYDAIKPFNSIHSQAPTKMGLFQKLRKRSEALEAVHSATTPLSDPSDSEQLYEAYNQLHTLAQVRCFYFHSFIYH